ncbi:VOC family protein [Pelagibacterium halotolerans]|uniref:Glyoxalase family protein n=1 Tax=Pelagibacterium halotolerans (strain DSM 22347 / JCM 15775 / CGMCC 1.7692 / B2) TaxID=1082931 RepID=G4R7B4_PELHB|nr:VOC family protein [Pelagibacterium halotolerans]AEQ51250.1 glyoxalase family protein [Pelagibacterium halotolerans B2]QJR18892.1 glyoxalase [Pelagibacterium halotolerans]SEA67305.1 Glyoxalase/Bleomycin resistance protein/Dioxygenase superfamily protein [Pelagibacterium halotolerans]
MRIIGPDELVFGVDDVAACREFLVDYGLMEKAFSDEGGRFEALDGSAFTIRKRDDASLPAPLPTANMLRQTIWGVEDQATLDAIEAELSKDRAVEKLADGTLTTRDDANFEIAFRITRRVALDLPAELINSPGAKPGRAPNVIGANDEVEARPRTLSHVVYFVPDMDKMANFYVERLGFVVTDKFTNTGPFLRPQANNDHHVLFMIQTPEYMQGLEHVAFHMQGPTELMLAGSRMVQKGYQSFWGPGRHKFGSNWFWYFNSPLGTHIEYDADMDLHDGDWVERETPMTKDAAQMFLFENVEKWVPGGPPPKK